LYPPKFIDTRERAEKNVPIHLQRELAMTRDCYVITLSDGKVHKCWPSPGKATQLKGPGFTIELSADKQKVRISNDGVSTKFITALEKTQDAPTKKFSGEKVAGKVGIFDTCVICDGETYCITGGCYDPGCGEFCDDDNGDG
jgi:hypothetical protein